MKKTQFSSYHFLWLAVVLLFPLVNVFWRPVAPNDYWWYVRIGKEIINTGTIPIRETFSYTQVGQPIIYHSWLSAVFFWGINILGGIDLTIFVAALMITGSYALLWKLMTEQGLNARGASAVLILVEITSSQNWAMRPQLFAYPIFVLSLYLLWHWEQGNDKYIWLLPFITMLWVNLHGSFALVFLLAGAAFVFGKGNRKTLGIVLAMMFLAMLINPRGLSVGDYLLNSLTNTSNQSFSVEWMPPENRGWQENIFFGSFFAIMLLVAFSSYKISVMGWSWLLGFGWLALSGSRYDIWYLFVFSVLGAALLAPLASRFKPKNEQKEKPIVNGIMATLLLLISILFFPSIRLRWLPDAPPTLSDTTPVAAAEWLREHPELPDPIWANLAFESYLVYAIPERPVWIDTRFEVYPPEHWQAYLDVSTARWNWEGLLDKDEINILFLSRISQKNLLKAVNTSYVWCEIYSDEQSAIYARRGVFGGCE